VDSSVLIEDVGKFLNSIIGPILILPILILPILILPISSTQQFGVVLPDV
jgi:hypothetical protein